MHLGNHFTEELDPDFLTRRERSRILRSGTSSDSLTQLRWLQFSVIGETSFLWARVKVEITVALMSTAVTFSHMPPMEGQVYVFSPEISAPWLLDSWSLKDNGFLLSVSWDAHLCKPTAMLSWANVPANPSHPLVSHVTCWHGNGPTVPSPVAPAGPVKAGNLSLLSPDKTVDVWSKLMIAVLSDYIVERITL